MSMTPVQTILTILALSLGIIVTRFTPFLLFPEGKEQPPIITYLGKVLPPAMMGLLIVFCLKGVSLVQAQGYFGIHSLKGDMPAVVFARAIGIEKFVICSTNIFTSGLLSKNPFAEFFLN